VKSVKVGINDFNHVLVGNSPNDSFRITVHPITNAHHVVFAVLQIDNMTRYEYDAVESYGVTVIVMNKKRHQ